MWITIITFITTGWELEMCFIDSNFLNQLIKDSFLVVTSNIESNINYVKADLSKNHSGTSNA